MTATKYGRIEVTDAGGLRVDGTHRATIHVEGDIAVVCSALSDLTASTPTVDGPEGLTGPSSEGTWYGLWAEVPLEGWELRTDGTAEWHKPMDTAMPVNSVVQRLRGLALVEARPVPLPVTEEVALHELIGRKLPGERWAVKSLDLKWVEAGSVLAAQCYPAGVEFLGSTKAVPVSPSGTVTVQREATS